MEWLIWLAVVITAVLIALVESLRFAPSSLSQAEVERRASRGDSNAQHELAKRSLLPLYYGLQRIKVTLLVLVLVGLVASIYQLWTALLISFGLLILVGVAVAMNWLGWLTRWLQLIIEPYLWKLVKTGAPVFKLLAPRGNAVGAPVFASKEELKQMIEHDTGVLSAAEKLRLSAAMHFDSKTVRQAMVPASKITTVGQSETVGPLLLDKLHKAGHNIVVVIGRSLDSVKGLLYMSDLVPLDPEIQTVKDVTRPKVYWVSADAPLNEVLAASLKTGRQLFLVAEAGKTVGLITLLDTLEIMLGSRPSKDAEVSASPDDL